MKRGGGSLAASHVFQAAILRRNRTAGFDLHAAKGCMLSNDRPAAATIECNLQGSGAG